MDDLYEEPACTVYNPNIPPLSKYTSFRVCDEPIISILPLQNHVLALSPSSIIIRQDGGLFHGKCDASILDLASSEQLNKDRVQFTCITGIRMTRKSPSFDHIITGDGRNAIFNESATRLCIRIRT
jgi:hypothetical protein